jgi:hypothetical protein
MFFKGNVSITSPSAWGGGGAQINVQVPNKCETAIGELWQNYRTNSHVTVEVPYAGAG